MDRTQKEMEYAVTRFDRNDRVAALQNGRLYNQYEQVEPYQRTSALYSSAPALKLGSDLRVQQNAAAVLYHSGIQKGKVVDGRQASAVAQMHQNDLHSVDAVQELGISKELLSNELVQHPDRSKNYIKRYLNLQTKFSRAQNGQQTSDREPQSDLITSFDPMKDRHLWTMWRTAVNGRIVDEVRHLERRKSEMGVNPSSNFDASIPGMYGKALVAPPLKRFIKFGDEESRAVAVQMSSGLGQGSLETSQFVYYGLPRVDVSHMRK
ncbi:unnamed protein product [Candidula unifasciata]|uniref:Uncharacterized protein n=1 Tax=Candidula unifasciata TaxID=100452 RepID=A0A8S4A677_9EUPU|nr:unnamed protein product [Candidula unifasciata]